MQIPVILLVDDETEVLDALEESLRSKYGTAYRFVRAESGEDGVSAVSQLHQGQENVALCLADLKMPGMNGAEFLAHTRRFFPQAGRVLLTPYASTEEAIRQINLIGINHYLVKPWQPASEKLYPVIDELLADWITAVQLPYLRVRGIMTPPLARIRHTANLHQAAEIVALSGIGDLMVVDEDGRFIGVLSEGDILRNALPDFDEIVEEGGTLYDAFQLFIRKGRELSDKPILPLVIHNPLVVHPNDHVAKAATVLIDRQIRRLPVVEDGRLVGTVSRANICQAVVGKL